MEGKYPDNRFDTKNVPKESSYFKFSTTNRIASDGIIYTKPTHNIPVSFSNNAMSSYEKNRIANIGTIADYESNGLNIDSPNNNDPISDRGASISNKDEFNFITNSDLSYSKTQQVNGVNQHGFKNHTSNRSNDFSSVRNNDPITYNDQRSFSDDHNRYNKDRMDNIPNKNHYRNGSESSSISNTSSNSTVTPTSNVSKDKRFVRYAMNRQAGSSVNNIKNWQMQNVIKWLSHHEFNDSWKETFRKNEISGNRFLELANYDKSSIIWRQFSKYLDVDDDTNSVDRFIYLLKEDIKEPLIFEDSQIIKVHSRSGSTESQSPLSINGFSINQSSLPTVSSLSNKPRPYSYAETTGSKGSTKEFFPSSSNKFFRKHYRSLSSDTIGSIESQLSGNSNQASSQKQYLMQHQKSTSYPNEFNTSDTKSKQPSLSLYPNQSSSSKGDATSHRKSRILSTLRKYGTDKAAEIVKQVHSTSTSSNKSYNQKSHKKQSSDGSQPSQSIQIPPKGAEFSKNNRNISNSSLTSSSAKTITNSDVDTPSIILPFSPPKVQIIQAETNEFGLEDKYLPKELDNISKSKFVLFTKDNRSFKPISLNGPEITDYSLFKEKIINSFHLINVGIISFHLTDLNSKAGEALPEELLMSILQKDSNRMFLICQELSSPSVATTFSTTSSDSKSFEINSENLDERKYPATPQYLLQQPKDKAIDYWNFKDKLYNLKEKSSHDLKTGESSHPSTRQNIHSFNMKIPSIANKKLANREDKLPTLSVDTNLTTGSSPSSANSGNSFRVIRKDNLEIDFDKRRKSPYEAKTPKLIPNIYSSSVSNSLKSPVTATTLNTLKDDPPSSTPSHINKETGSEIVAKRAAPPPPLSNKSSLKKTASKKWKLLTIGNLDISNSSYSSEDSMSNRSFSSIRSSFKSSSIKSKDSKKKNHVSKEDAFKENPISFEGVPTLDINNSFDDTSDDDFFLKPIKGSSTSLLDRENVRDSNSDTHNNVDDDNTDDFFMKPLNKSNKSDNANNTEQSISPKMKENNNNTDESPGFPMHKMNVRPPIEEVYNNLEKYFPNTNLDKPIIEETSVPNVASSQNITTARKPSIARTFSNANISPVEKKSDSGDEIFYGDGITPGLSRRRMKTIRVVANEARSKRLAQRKAPPSLNISGDSIRTAPSGLNRSNTKMWGQRVVEVTSTEIEQGFVSKLKNNKNGEFEEFAWIKGELIGRGSFGSVYLALNVTTGEMLAVKQVVARDYRNNEHSDHNEGINALHKEVETMKDLDHLNIVQYLGFEQKNNIYSLFLEYVAGGSISYCLKSFGRFEEQLIKFIIRQVLLGLEYLHANRILHRDLKADNLLLEIDGTCKISDFGISKKSKDIYANDAEMSMQGTVFWMAPEVIDSIVEDKKQGYSAKIDIWSLGCVVLEMFAGKRPWSNEAVVSAIYKIGKTKLAPPIPDDIKHLMSAEAKEFIKKCFTIDPNERPTAKELLEHPFMTVNKDFVFEKTKLGQMIKYNSRSVFSASE